MRQVLLLAIKALGYGEEPCGPEMFDLSNDMEVEMKEADLEVSERTSLGAKQRLKAP